jgi:hypothetical protein
VWKIGAKQEAYRMKRGKLRTQCHEIMEIRIEHLGAGPEGLKAKEI